MNQNAQSVGLLALHYCTSRMMDVPVVYWPMMPDAVDLSAMYSAEKRVRSLYATDQQRAANDPWRHIRELPSIFDASAMPLETQYEFMRNAEVDDQLPDRPRLGFENAWAVAEGRALPPHNIEAQQSREVVADYGKEQDLKNALAAAKDSGTPEDVAAAETALRRHQARMMRRQIIHSIQDHREALRFAQWSEDSDKAKRLTETVESLERLANAQRLCAEAEEKGDKELQSVYSEQIQEARRSIHIMTVRRKLDEATAATNRAKNSGNEQQIAACVAAEAPIREEFGKLLQADETEVPADETPADENPAT